MKLFSINILYKGESEASLLKVTVFLIWWELPLNCSCQAVKTWLYFKTQKLFQNGFDLSSISFFQRGTAQDFITFTCKILVERTAIGSRQSVCCIQYVQTSWWTWNRLAGQGGRIYVPCFCSGGQSCCSCGQRPWVSTKSSSYNAHEVCICLSLPFWTYLFRGTAFSVFKMISNLQNHYVKWLSLDAVRILLVKSALPSGPVVVR